VRAAHSAAALAQATRPQLQAHQRGEGLLGRPARGAAATERLGQPYGVRQAPVGGPVHHVADPPLDESERGIQPGQRRLLRLGLLGREDALHGQLAHALRVGRIEPAHGLLDGLAVDPDARRVGLDRTQHVTAQPGHVAEEPLVCGLAQRDVQPDLVFGDFQALAVRGDVRGNERGSAGRTERKTDVARGEHLAGEACQGVAELARP
jgi:hypothetical protein